jgi:hypothetical protein
MQTNCNIKSCPNFGRYRRTCGHGEATIAPPKPTATFSKKREKINKTQYYPEARAFVNANPECQLKLKGCTRKTQGVHHPRGRSTIALLLDKRWWMPACNNCNTKVEEKTKEAVEKGLKKSKFNVN